MLSHVTVGVSDLERSGRFYDAVLAPMGWVRRAVKPDGGPPSLCWHDPVTDFPRFFAYMPFDGAPASAGNGSMTAFLAPSQDAVARAYEAGLKAGGTDDGAPGLRLNYGPTYFGAYLRDPDGNKVHVVHRADVRTPNAATRAALDAAERGEVTRVADVDALLDDLKDEGE